MNVELSTAQTNTNNDVKASNANVTNSVKDSSKSFKDELTQKTDGTKSAEQKNVEAKVTEEQLIKNADENNTKKTKGHENQINADSNDRKSILKIAKENTEVLHSISELNNEIENLSRLKIGSVSTKTSDLKAEKTDDMSTIKMNETDAMFFINLVENKEMNVQSVQQQINNQTQNVTSVVQTQQSEKTQQTMSLTQTLLDKLSESMNTNKPFRIDFDNDIAVIMKVNKDGSLSANFIPGSAAVENYLRNNIASLRQNFDEQELSYSELTYSNQKDERRKGQQNKEKGNE